MANFTILLEKNSHNAPKSYRWSGDLDNNLCLSCRWKIDRFRLRFMRGN